MIHSLRRKPGAFIGLAYRDQLFPRQAYARTFEALLAGRSEKEACRMIVDLLFLAHERTCEAELAKQLTCGLEAGRLPDMKCLRERFTPDPAALPVVTVSPPPLSVYNELTNFSTEMAA